MVKEIKNPGEKKKKPVKKPISHLTCLRFLPNKKTHLAHKIMTP